jgi:hypothetical protein
MANLIRRLDPLSRTAFGLLCIAGMSLWAMPVLAIVGVIGGIGTAVGGDLSRALGVWLGSWAAAGFAAMLFLGISFTFWPLASDWIIEWPGYATALVIGAAGLGLMAFTVFITDWPLALEVLAPLFATFAAGFAVPGRFLGLRAVRGGPPEPAGLARRR